MEEKFRGKIGTISFEKLGLVVSQADPDSSSPGRERGGGEGGGGGGTDQKFKISKLRNACTQDFSSNGTKKVYFRLDRKLIEIMMFVAISVSVLDA